MAVQILDGDGSSDVHYRKQIFMAADGHPVTFRNMMDLCKESGVYEGDVTFTGSEGAGGKEADNSKSRQQLAWQPQFDSFESFLNGHKGKDFYSG